jgi:hypothetical protein
MILNIITCPTKTSMGKKAKKAAKPPTPSESEEELQEVNVDELDSDQLEGYGAEDDYSSDGDAKMRVVDSRNVLNA